MKNDPFALCQKKNDGCLEIHFPLPELEKTKVLLFYSHRFGLCMRPANVRSIVSCFFRDKGDGIRNSKTQNAGPIASLKTPGPTLKGFVHHKHSLTYFPIYFPYHQGYLKIESKRSGHRNRGPSDHFGQTACSTLQLGPTVKHLIPPPYNNKRQRQSTTCSSGHSLSAISQATLGPTSCTISFVTQHDYCCTTHSFSDISACRS